VCVCVMHVYLGICNVCVFGCGGCIWGYRVCVCVCVCVFGSMFIYVFIWGVVNTSCGSLSSRHIPGAIFYP